MSSGDKSKTKFSPSNNLFDKIKYNFELNQKNTDKVNNNQNKKGFSSFIQKTRSLNNRKDLNTQLVSGIATRLLNNVNNDSLDSKNPTAVVNADTIVQENINNVEHSKNLKTNKNSSEYIHGFLLFSSDEQNKISTKVDKTLQNKQTKNLEYLHKEEIENAVATSRNLAGIKINQKKFIYENISKIDSTLSPSGAVLQKSLQQNTSSDKNNLKLKSTNDHNVITNQLNKNSRSTMVNKSSKDILLGAFNDTHMLSLTLKQELLQSKDIISKLTEENKKLKEQNVRLVNNYHSIYDNFANLFEDFKKFKENVTIKVKESNDLKNKFSFLKNEIVTLKKSIIKVNTIIHYLKEEIKQNEILLVEKNVKLLAKEEKINFLKSQKNDYIDPIRIKEDIIDSLENMLIQKVNHLNNFFKKDLLKASAKQTETFLQILLKESSKQQKMIKNELIGMVDYNKIKLIVKKIIDEKTLITLETNKVLIINKLIPYLDANIAKIDEKWNNSQNMIFNNFNLILSACFEKTTSFIFQKVNVIEEEIRKLKRVIQQVEANNECISNKLKSLKFVENGFLNLKKEIMKNNYQAFETILQKISVLNKIVPESVATTQKHKIKLDCMFQTLNEIKLNHLIMKQNLNIRSDFLEQELCILKKLVNDNLKKRNWAVEKILCEYEDYAVSYGSDLYKKFIETKDFDEILSSDESFQTPQKLEKQEETVQNCISTSVFSIQNDNNFPRYNNHRGSFLQEMSSKNDILMASESLLKIDNACTRRLAKELNQTKLIQDATTPDLTIQKRFHPNISDPLYSKNLNTVFYENNCNKITKTTNKKLRNKRISDYNQSRKSPREEDENTRI